MIALYNTLPVPGFPGRSLSTSELALAFRVFKGSLPYPKIVISPVIGLHSRPFTTTFPPLLPNFSPLAYIVNIGFSGFNRGMDVTDPGTLIHELTHVWQGAHALDSSAFMWDSITHQGMELITKVDPYAYAPGKSWFNYAAEQQAHIVEDWFNRGAIESDTDNLFRYVRDNIRSLLWFV